MARFSRVFALLGLDVQLDHARLREALSQLSGFAETSSSTNSLPLAPGVKTRVTGARGDVSVVVIQ